MDTAALARGVKRWSVHRTIKDGASLGDRNKTIEDRVAHGFMQGPPSSRPRRRCEAGFAIAPASHPYHRCAVPWPAQSRWLDRHDVQRVTVADVEGMLLDVREPRSG